LTVKADIAGEIYVLKRWSELSKSAKDECCNAIIDIATRRRLSIDEIYQLALGLAMTGKIWKWNFEYFPILDICSTGGPASLSTLLSPLMAATQGVLLAQLSVPGEIAGAIDTLGIIPEFKYKQTYNSIKAILLESNIAFALNSKELAPGDLHLFNLRSTRRAKDIPDLVIASLLSKKISTGVNNSIIDIRVGPHGNFGKSYGEARGNCEKLVLVCRSLGMNCRCVLTNHFVSPMPYYGRAESLKALFEIITGKISSEWLLQHLNTCAEIAAVAVALVKKSSLEGERLALRRSLKKGKVRDILIRNLEAQGSSLKNLKMIINEANATNRMVMRTQVDGYFVGIDYGALQTLMKENAWDSESESRAKSLVGLKLLIREGIQVRKGVNMLEIRGNPEILSKYTKIIEKIGVIIANKPEDEERPTYEVIAFG
jgi:pyrimidine-nucleoside phosphorylase